jgi:hypothetical protein
MTLAHAASLRTVLIFGLSSVFAAIVDLAFCGVADEAIQEQEESWWSASLISEYDSKYVFRGVNSLPGSGIGVVDLTLTAYDFSLEIWHASGLRRTYQEIYFRLDYTREFGPVAISAGYINYYFPNGDRVKGGFKDTQELFAEASYEFASSFTASFAYYSDVDKINGSYLELKLADRIPVVKETVSLEPYAAISYDFRYNSRTRGLNNFEAGLSLPVAISKHTSVAAFAALSIPLHAIGAIAEKEAWGGVRVSFVF